MQTISFFYKNHRGVVEERTIDVDSIEWLANPAHGYQPSWFISGRCHDHDARRSFALASIQLPEGARTSNGFKLFVVKS